MKYSAVALFAAGAYAAATTSTGPITAAPAVATLTPQESCVQANCKDSNVDCRASCYSVPFQGSANVAQNVQCVSTACMSYQTAGVSSTSAYASCVESCRNKYFYNPTNAGGAPDVGGGNAQQTGSPKASGAGSNSGSGSGSNGGSGSNASGTNASASASATGKSAANKYTYSAAGIIGAFGLIALAL